MSDTNTDAPPVAQDDKKPRHRSPNYPAVGLRKAAELVGKLWEADGKAGAPPEIVAVHIGFAKAHGQAMSTVAALKKFGLVAESNGRLVPSQRAIEIVNLPEDDARRQKALREAVVSPELYRELIKDHQTTGWPKADVLERELVTYKKFNPSAVKGFVADLFDSLQFAGVSDLSALELNEEAEEPKREGRISQPRAETPKQKGVQAQADPMTVFFGAKPMQRSYSFGLSENVNAKVEIVGPAEVDDLEALKDYVDTLIKSWKRKLAKSQDDGQKEGV